METTGLPFPSLLALVYLLQMVTPSSEQFTVSGLARPVLASLGENVDLSCQLSPPQSAQHMEVRWFRNRYTQPVHLYENGKDMQGETISQYVERTVLLTEAIGEGKVILRILNVSVDDDGQYHCLFKDGDFYEEAITEVQVTATSLEIQILMHPPNIKGLMVECKSEGWYPQPQMEWRDSRGEIILPISRNHSRDRNKLFNVKMSLLLTGSSQENVTCYLRNPVTGQEERTSIVLSDKLFPGKNIWILILFVMMAVLLFFIMVPSIELHFRQNCNLKDWKSPLIVGLGIVFPSVGVIVGVVVSLHKKERVPVSDPQFQLDTLWLEDMSVILCMLLIFITMLISFIYFRLRAALQSNHVHFPAN
uniref:Ig-like domain-containing protein n=1 Tax=Otolemur garnettii TaxID=30611 RepID=H0XN01_OTOGA